MNAPPDNPARSWQWPFLIAIGALLVSGGLAVLQYTRFADAAALVDHAYEVLESIDRALTRLVDAETGHRGYLLTKDRAFLQPYEGAAAETHAMVGRLINLVADNPEQQSRARRLAALADDRLAEMARVLELSERGDAAGVTARLSTGVGKRVMEDVRTVAAEMRAAEDSRLSQRAYQARLARRSAQAFAIGTLLVAVALSALAVSVYRNFERRHLALATEIQARGVAERQALAAAASLQQIETFNKNILDHSGDCIQVLEPDGRVVLVNRPGLSLLEVDDSNGLVGDSWTTTWNDDAALARQAIDDAIVKGEGRFHAFRPTVKGTPKWWDVIVTPIRDGAEDDEVGGASGTVQKLVTVSRDITEQKYAEQERAQLLASERAARSEAERAARLKDDFVSTLSHELRTPLNAILGWIGVLKQQQSPETLAKAIDVIDRNSRRQSQMVDDLLDVSRIMSGKLRLEVQRVDVPSVIEEAVASAQPAADAKGVRLVKVLGSAAIIQGDPGRLQQIVWNLVSNAIKFTPRGGLVQVTLRMAGSHVQVQVSDSGQGITADVLPHVFQRFRQGDASATRHHGGLGLGLAIVKNLVEMHGGSVEAASDGEGLGSVFSVRLPLAHVSARPEQMAETLELVPEKLNSLLDGLDVLVLDDEPDARDVVQRLLEDAGARTQIASSAGEALQLLEQGFVPDIIVSDIGMPDQDGYDFMQQVRCMSGEVADVPAAALTALARLEDRKRALMAGYQTHLAKPVDPAELVATVASLTGRTGRSNL
jgi:signal transduction histidine kinase/CHASE3 domain sensor protein/ActR/RegA family two-component response regulator